MLTSDGGGGGSVGGNGNVITTTNTTTSGHRKGHRRQESMYDQCGLYSETATDDSNSSVDAPLNTESTSCIPNDSSVHLTSNIIKCHSRQPSNLVERDKPQIDEINNMDCGILNYHPKFIQKFARIKVFVLLLSVLVTLQQALSSGYINSVITTIEKRFEIPSSLSGLIASSYEIGNVITVIFVSYLGTRRKIPVWIGIGAVIMGLGSLVFMVPHFTGEPNPGISLLNRSSENICRGVSLREDVMGLGSLSSLSNPPLAPLNNLRGDNCIQSKSSTFGPVFLFVIAQLLLGCGGSPLFTLGTTYVDDHVRSESSSMYIGCMYSSAAFGPVIGFLLGAYLLTLHMDSFSSTIISIETNDRRWVGMWWGGFVIGGLLLILVSIPFFSFPKVLTLEKKKIQNIENLPQIVTTTTTTQSNNSTTLQRKQSIQIQAGNQQQKRKASESKKDTGYGKDIKDLPRSMLRLVRNPVYVVTCLGACMELMIVSGFVVFLPKYLETQFSLGKSQASVFTGSIAIPGACIGIFIGGCILKRLELKPKGAVEFVLISNLVCLACYGLLFFLGCDNLKMAGTTIPYYNSSTRTSEPFQVNLTAACNFGCECHMSDVEPVCGNNGLTYFSPCHAGCTSFSSSNYSNCACVHANITNFYTGAGGGGSGSIAQASIAHENSDVTIIPVATAGPCMTPCSTIYPFLILLFFMTFIVASTQMPLLMIVLRSVSEEERSFALGMQFVIFRLFGYIPAPILFGNLIDSTCLLWKSTCGETGGRCLIYDIEQFRYKYVGLCASIKVVALIIFIIDWYLVKKRKHMENPVPGNEIVGSIISLNKLFEDKGCVESQSFPFNGEVITEEYSENGDPNKRIIIASRHLRNESKTIQLEFRHDDNTLDNKKKKRQHFRSNSCDIKIGQRDNDDYKLNKKNQQQQRSHSRNNSRDFSDDFRQKLTQHSRIDGGQQQPVNIKYIINHFKNSVKETDQLKKIVTDDFRNAKKNKKNQHTRNYSCDEEFNYLKKNDLTNKLIESNFHKNSKEDINLLKNINANITSEHSDIKFESKYSTQHSRTNSKDLNSIKILDTPTTTTLPSSSLILPITVDDSSSNNILRHRRTNSKDLKTQQQHKKNPSQHKIQIDDNNEFESNEIMMLNIKSDIITTTAPV